MGDRSVAAEPVRLTDGIPAAQHGDRNQQLPDMPLRMLGGVYKKSEHCRRQLRSTNTPVFRKRPVIRCAKPR